VDLNKAIRIDQGELSALEVSKDFLRARVVLARTGVFPYVYPDGSVKMEAKLPEELSRPETIKSAQGVPVADGHPPSTENQGLITTETYKAYAKGSVFEVTMGPDGCLAGSETIWDQSLINSLKAGEKLQVSIGFTCDLDSTPGELNGEKYEVAQRNIIINHLAHVEKGRAGEEVRAYLDQAIPEGSAYQKTDSKDQKTTIRQDAMDKSKVKAAMNGLLNSLGIKLDEEDPAKPPAGTGEGGSTEPPAQDKSAQKDSETMELLKAQVEALKGILAEKTRLLEEALSPATQDALVAKRLTLIESAKQVAPDSKLDGLSNRELKLLVIEKSLPFASGVKLDSVKDESLDARYDAALELARHTANRGDSSGNKGNESKLDEAAIQEKKQKRLNMFEGAK
jgi:uncharacterized protein